MIVSQIENAQNQVVLSIEVEPDEVEEHVSRVYKKLVQRINVPGFRKGKAPRSVIEREVGLDAMRNEAMETLIPQLTSKAIENEGLDIVTSPRVSVSQQDPLTIEATIAIRPIVIIDDYYEYRLEPEHVDVTNESLEESMNELLRESGTWNPVEQPVAPDNMVTMKVVGKVEDKVIIDDSSVEYLVTYGSANPMLGFAEELVGIARNGAKDFSLSFPEGYIQPDLSGKECSFSVTVEEVKELSLPTLDDSFAKSLNQEVNTVDQLKDKLKGDLLKRNQSIADQKYQDTAIDALVERSTFDLPPLLVDHEVDHILSEQAEGMRRQQVSMEDYLATVGKTIEELQEEARPSAVERVTKRLVLTALKEKEDVDVSQDEVETELESMVGESETENQYLRQLFDNENGRTSITNILLNRKIMDRLTAIAKGEADIATPPETDEPTAVDKSEGA